MRLNVILRLHCFPNKKEKAFKEHVEESLVAALLCKLNEGKFVFRLGKKYIICI
jgi:hypothetical protein